MPKPNALVNSIKNISPSKKISSLAHDLSEVTTVNFEGDRSGLLDMKNPRSVHWANILKRLNETKRPVYVEIDPETSIITKLLIPEISKVHSLDTGTGGDITVKLIPSQTIHHLLRSNPDFDDMKQLLQSAKDDNSEILVTKTRDEHEIIDVRPLPKAPGGMPSPAPPAPDDPPVSEQRARELFNLMASKTCDPCTAPPPCIPFLYPDDGCYARAHEMCRLMFDEGEVPEKVWIYGDLNVETSNNPDCEVGWWYHVAPTLLVTTGSGEEKWVIDPSLFNEPVTVEQWKAKQGDPSATLDYTDASIYSPSGGTDPDYSRTNAALQDKRDLLVDRCLDYGPPPYVCPIVKNSFFIIDRNTFSEYEITAMLQLGSPAVIEAAFYVVVDGFSPEELGITAATLIDPPNVAPAITPAPNVAEMSIQASHIDLEDPSHLKRRQRLTWTYNVSFTGTSAFVNDTQTVTLSASISDVSCSAVIYLIKQPNPFEVDGQTSWLSTDLRVFQIKAGESRFGVTINADPSTFITQVINNLNSGNSAGQTFDDISTNQQTSKLELSERVNGVSVFNFAVAKIHYRALDVSAPDVRVFFRLFPYTSTSLEYDEATGYRRGGQGGNIIALLGIKNNEIISIPCFASSRVDTATTNMNVQIDAPNVQTFPPDASGAEVIRYFGCWLDINQTQPQFPINPSPADGPFPSSRKTIQELIRNRHQCLVAEIAFLPDPIFPGATPSSSDNLAQRNLAIVESANPGNIASHRISNTFDVRPSSSENNPDELMIDWGSTPVGSLANIYLPAADANEVIKLAAKMYRSHGLIRLDSHTIQCLTGGITYIPIPQAKDKSNFAGMITVDLPAMVKKGQAFIIIVRQVTSAESIATKRIASGPPVRWRRILGTFQITIPVKEKEAIVVPETRLLSNLLWIQKAIPNNNRWFSVFRRYVSQVSARVDALGGDSSKVDPSPSGGTTPPSTIKRCSVLNFAVIVLLAALVVGIGLSGYAASLPILILLGAVILFWVRNCKPRPCRLLQMFVVGLITGIVILMILSFPDKFTPQVVITIVVSAAIAIIAFIGGWIKYCFKKV